MQGVGKKVDPVWQFLNCDRCRIRVGRKPNKCALMDSTVYSFDRASIYSRDPDSNVCIPVALRRSGIERPHALAIPACTFRKGALGKGRTNDPSYVDILNLDSLSIMLHPAQGGRYCTTKVKINGMS